jgi:hypothetical protein
MKLLAIMMLVIAASDDGAGAAREALTREALELMGGPEGPAFFERNPTPWVDPHWFSNGPGGAVGRLHQICKAANEPPPDVLRGAAWDATDPRTLSPNDRSVVRDWLGRVLVAGMTCGTYFELAEESLGAQGRVDRCPEGVRAARAFLAYVDRRPELKTREDRPAVTTEALLAAGCQQRLTPR